MTRQRRHDRTDRRRSREVQAWYEKAIRTCCATANREPHLESCKRHPTRCRDKTAWRARDMAQAAAATLVESRGRMTPYRCDSCGQWHIGHPRSPAEGLET